MMTGGAAAALTGLIFLALSLHAKAIVAHPLYRDRALASILSLTVLIFLSGAVLVPQPALVLGVEVELVVVYFIIRVVSAARLIHRQGPEHWRRRRALWIREWAAWTLWLVIFVASGIEIAIVAPAGLYLLAFTMAYTIALDVWNAWVLIVEVSEDRRP